jgi:glycosyltransferase involved in cell wall biosynthesis
MADQKTDKIWVRNPHVGQVNILIISNCPLKINQGSGYVICGFAEGMKRRGHSVRAFGPDEFILFPKARAAKRLRLFAGYTLKAIREACNLEARLDIIELWGGPGWLACLILTALRAGKYKVISRSNGLEPHYRLVCKKQSKRLSARRLMAVFESWTDSIGFRNADSLTVVSRYDEEFALRNGYQQRSRLLTIENPVPEDWLGQTIQERDNKLSIGFVGSWLDNKGVSTLIDVIKSLAAMKIECTWVIAGVGQEGKLELDQLQLALGHARLEAYEQVSREELKSLYQKMTVFLCLSTYESFGMVCTEAMACGCILLSTEVGFAHGLKDGVEFLSAEGCTAQQIASKIYQIEQDKTRYKQIGRCGLERVQQLSWSKAIDRLESHYEMLMSTARN